MKDSSLLPIHFHLLAKGSSSPLLGLLIVLGFELDLRLGSNCGDGGWEPLPYVYTCMHPSKVPSVRA